MEKKKESYDAVRVELILLEFPDIITGSNLPDDDGPPDEGDLDTWS